jgi:hypothetical protein
LHWRLLKGRPQHGGGSAEGEAVRKGGCLVEGQHHTAHRLWQHA